MTLQFVRLNGTNFAESIDWEVIEFNNVKSVQRGMNLLTGTSTDITVNSVNYGKSLVFATFTANDMSHLMNVAYGSLNIHMSGNTYFTVICEPGYQSYFTVYWQVIEFK